ncbi:MAG: hypothetical protein ACK5MG_00690 [Bacteroidales bacterium]
MKKNLLRITIILLSIGMINSCIGPQGEPGRDGLDGSNTIGETLEISANFLEQYNYTERITLSPAIYDGDAIFVYWRSSENPNVWRPLPYTVYFEDGNELDYMFDYTLNDVQIYLGFTHASPPVDYSSNQIFRIVIIPSQLIQSTTGLNKDSLKYMEYNELINTLKNNNVNFTERTIVE